MKFQDRRVVLLLGLVTFFRLIYINFVPLVPQEAYYWKYAKHLALSYFDHPPMAAYTIAFFTWIGGDSAFFIRLGSVLYSLGMLIILYKIVLLLFKDRDIAFKVLLTISLTALFSVGASIITPDVPLLFFWTVMVYAFVKLRETGQARWWYLAGVGLGFGLVSKYTAILIVPGIILYLLYSPEHRKWLWSPHPYLAVLLAGVIFSPVIIWNQEHDWASFAFQSSRRLGEMKRFRLNYLGQLIGSQFAMLTPYIFLIVFVGWAQNGWLGWKKKNDTYFFLFALSAPVIVLFTFSSLRSLVKMNWLAPAYITAMIGAIAWLYQTDGFSKRMRNWYKGGVILALVLVVVVHSLPLFPIAPIRRGDTWTGWPELVSTIEELKKDMRADTFVFGHEYKIPSEITYYSRDHKQETHAGEIIGLDGLQYTFWTDIESLKGRDAIFVFSNAERYHKIDRLNMYFERVEKVEPLRIEHYGKLFREFIFYRCYNYRGDKPEEPHVD